MVSAQMVYFLYMVSILRRTGVFLAVSSLYFLVSFSSVHAASWATLGTTYGSMDTGEPTNIAVHPVSGEIYVAYSDTVNSLRATVKKYNATTTSWEVVGTAGFTPSRASYVRIAFNPTTYEPYVAYRDYSLSGRLTVKRFNGSTWVTVDYLELGGFTASAEENSFAFNESTSEPYVAYRDAGASSKITVQKWDGSTWGYVGARGFGGGSGVFDTSIAFNPVTHEPYVAYGEIDSSYALTKATVKKYNATTTSWETVGTEKFSSGNAYDTTIAFDLVTGDPYVAYRDGSAGNKATVKRFDGSTWVTVGVEGFGYNKTYGIKIRFNPTTNVPYVVYDGGIMKFNGTSWLTLGSNWTADNLVSDFVFGTTTTAGGVYITNIEEVKYLTGAPDAPVMSPYGGNFYTSSLLVTLSTATTGASIYYTTNGSTPSATSTLYSGAISISASTTIKAISVKSGFPNSDVVSQFYEKKEGGEWTVVGTRQFAGLSGLDIAINPVTYEPYVLAPSGVNLVLKRFSSTTSIWESLGGDALAPERVEFGWVLGISPLTGEPYVAYTDYAASSLDERPSVLKYNGSSWVDVGGTVSSGFGYVTSIIFDPDDGTPYITGFNNNISEKVFVKKLSGSSWVDVGSGFGTAAYWGTSDITFSSSTSEPYLVYADSNNANKLTVLRFNGTVWDVVGSRGFSSPIYGSSKIKIAINPTTHQPYVVYSTAATTNAVMRFNDTSWENVGATSTGTGAAKGLKFNLSTGEPHMLLVSSTYPTYYTNVLKFNGTSWGNLGASNFNLDADASADFDFNASTSQMFVLAGGTVQSSPLAVSTPVASSLGGTYSSTQLVTLSSATDGSTIYYTDDGSVPDTSSTVYTSAISVSSALTLKAFAVKAGQEDSAIMSESYLFQTATPTPSIPSGTYSSAQSVTLTSTTSGVTIYYTTDGSTPTTESTLYTGSITISASSTLKALAIKSLYADSGVMTETYTITPSTTPTVTTGSASSLAQTTVTLGGNITALGTTNVTERGIVYGATASYGATTSTTSASFSTGAYTENITGLTCGTTYHFSGYALNSIGTDYGSDDTFTTSACDLNQTATPTASPAGGTYTEGKTVTLTSATPSATIFYTTDGSTPATTTSTTYTTPLSVSSTVTYKAIAWASGYTDSTVMTETYTITPSTTPTVTTGSASSLAQTTVTLGGNITALGTTNVTERGIVYGATASYGATTSTTSASFSTGAYTEDITGLTCGTTYHFSAYAVNSIGTDYGSDDTFTTSACGAIATITSNSYTVSALGTSNETISNVPYGTAKAVFLSALTSGQSSQTRNSTAVNDPVTTGDVLVVTAEDGTTIVNYTLSVLSLTAEQVVPDGSGFATVNSTTPEVVITDLGSTASVTVSSGTSDATINLGAFIANGTGTIPAIQVIAQNAYNMSVEIPASTVVTSASTTWNGVLTAPTVTTITLPTESGITKALSTAIEVGFVGESLTFSKAVRLLIPNEAGKRVGYSVTSTFTEITDTCASDNQVTGDALSSGAECKIDVGSDLVIWTKHFTTFATYSQTTTSSSGGGGGGSSSSRRTTTTATTTSATSTATSTASTNTSEIEQLLNLLAVLKAQLQALLKTTASSASVSLTRNLELGMEGEDVRALQAYLNTHGYPVSQSGVGSLGNESTHFGPGTKSAVIKFQNAHASTLLTPINLTSGTGYVGEKTRALINGVSSAIAVTPKPVAPPVTVPVTPVVVPKTVPTIVQKPVAPVVQKPVVVSPPAVQTLKIGMVSEDVLKLQIFLNNNGFLIAYNGTGSLGNETTSFGIATEAAVMRYQNEFLDELGLTEATGIVDRVTRAHMGF